MRRLMADEPLEGTKYLPYINTGGPMDIVTGKFVPSTTGGYALSGGLGLTTAVAARPNRFKSSLLHSCNVNALARFPDAQYYNDDTEYAVTDVNRITSMSSLYLDDPVKRATHLEDLKSRITLFDPTHEVAKSLDAYIDFVKLLRDEKIRHAKDYEVETEIFDTDTGKPYRMLLPTLVGIDSWSEAQVENVIMKNEEFTADTEQSKQNTVNLAEGSKKMQLMRQLPRIAAQAGIYFYMSGHIQNKFSIDGKPTQKDMAYMKQDETVKGMGSKFYFLMSNYIALNNTRPKVDKADPKESEFPSKIHHLSGSELQEIDLMLVRSKNTNSGLQTQLISSQKFGIMNAMTYYNALRNNKYYGIGNPSKVRSPFFPEMDLGRTKIFDLSGHYKIERALELTFQLWFIQNNWTLMGQTVDFSMPIETFVEKLTQSSYAMDDILNSRGWWTYKGAEGEHCERPLLTLPDILEIASGNYKPKFLAVKG